MFGVLPSQVRARYAALKLPILSLSFTDDEFLRRRNIEFRSRCEASLWPRVADWIDRHVEMQH